jgi:hypothetical protein
MSNIEIINFIEDLQLEMIDDHGTLPTIEEICTYISISLEDAKFFNDQKTVMENELVLQFLCRRENNV